MSLKWKINLILIVAFAMLGATIYFVEQRIVRPSFVALEESTARDDMTRCIDAIQREVEHLTILCGDWAAWDDAYQFAADKNQAFTKANLVADSFKNNHVDFLAVIDAQKQVVWSGRADREKVELMPADDLTRQVFKTPGIYPSAEPGSLVSGVIHTSSGPMLVAARPILTSENKGPSRGTLLMGRFFGQDEVAAMCTRTRVNVKVWGVRDSEMPAEERTILGSLSPKGMHIRLDKPDLVQISATVPDIQGNAALYLRADIPASIRARGEIAVWGAVMTAIVTGALIVTYISMVLNREIVKPVTRVTQHAKAVSASDDLTTMLNMKRGDEIGMLANEFDRMVEHLARSRSTIVDNAHKAGMAEIASEVLHNVGNALNTVNVATQAIEERIRSSRVPNLNKAVKMLDENKSNLQQFLSADPRGSKLLDYLIGLAEVFAADQQAQLNDLATLQSRVEHINDVISVQQAIATHREVIQTVEIPKILEDVIAMNADQLRKHNIDVQRQMAPLPPVEINKSKLVQVIVNLVKNAIEAISTASPGGGTLTVRTLKASDAEFGIELTDTGGGIAAENLPKIFSSGFTTKSNGNGIGLHFCANTIRAMGGTIQVHSEGTGKGATFSLRLPMSRKEQTV